MTPNRREFLKGLVATTAAAAVAGGTLVAQAAPATPVLTPDEAEVGEPFYFQLDTVVPHETLTDQCENDEEGRYFIHGVTNKLGEHFLKSVTRAADGRHIVWRAGPEMVHERDFDQDAERFRCHGRGWFIEEEWVAKELRAHLLQQKLSPKGLVIGKLEARTG